MPGVRNIGSLPDHDTMSVHTSSVRIRKDSAMIVRPVPVPLACSTPLPAHNSTPHAAPAGWAVPHGADHTPHCVSRCPVPDPLLATSPFTAQVPLPARAPFLDVPTDHAGLVVLGKYAQHLGLIARLQTVPVPQRSRTYTPQTKLIQFFVGILAGLDYLQDFNLAPHPLVTDQAVLASWQQDAFAHYSGVSRTLAAADPGPWLRSRLCSRRFPNPSLTWKCSRWYARGSP